MARDDVQIIGPFEVHRVVFQGRYVPFLTAAPQEDGSTALILDKRFSMYVPAEMLHTTVWFLANAIAIGMGFACFPREDEAAPTPKPPFGGIVRGVSSTASEPLLSAVPSPSDTP